MSRRVKQVIYAFIFLIFWTVLIAGIYFLLLRPNPSCFDRVQDQGELGVDCGGPCSKVCIPSTIQPITSLQNVYVFTPLAGHVTLLANVQNPNSDFAADTFDYVFNLYDASGNVIQSIPGTSFMYADETKYLVVPNEAVSEAVDHASIAIGNIHWIPGSQLGLVPKLTFKNVQTVAAGTSTIAVGGQIVDADSASFQDVTVVAILKNLLGNPSGVSETEVDSVAPNQSENFTVMYPAIQNIDPNATQVYAYALRN